MPTTNELTDGINKTLDLLVEKIDKQDDQLKELSNKLETLSRHSDNSLKKFDDKLTALGARWGIQSENSFRNAMTGILADIGYSVEKYRKIDTEGQVHGHTCEVEIDVAVSNGMIVLIEIKSSLDHWDVYTFNRIAEFYEHQENKKADRKMIISPFVTERVVNVAADLGIQIFTDIQ